MNLTELLRSAGYKATPRRIALLRVLARDTHAMSIADISAKLESKLNQTTIYRALDDLVEAGIVRRVDMQHQHAHYELEATQPHHHHLICKSCGTVEDTQECDIPALERRVLRGSKKFSAIKMHSLEFFSICNKCA